MPKTKISEFSSTPANNTDIDSINISEGCAPSSINDAIRELMAQLKDFQTGAVGDSFNGPIGSTTASTGAFTTVTATSAATTNSEARSVIKLADTSSVAQGNGGGLLFRGVYTGSTLVDAAGVQAYKANATDNDYSYGLAFVTRANGGNLTANMKLDQSGNLGLGVTPSAWASSMKAVQIGTLSSLHQNDSGSFYTSRNSYNSSTGYRYLTTETAQLFGPQSNGAFAWYNAPSGTAGNAITWTQAMTLDASGNLLVGTTSAGGQGGLTVYPNGSGTSVQLSFKKAADGVQNTVQVFFAGASQVGSVTYTNTATAFNTSSDYRLKNTIAPMTGALAKVALLKPCTYKWNADGSDGEGFIAHELAQVVPQCVTGEKDAVNEDGSIKPQGIDTSFLVATLTAALQEAHSLIKNLETRISALEAK